MSLAHWPCRVEPDEIGSNWRQVCVRERERDTEKSVCVFFWWKKDDLDDDRCNLRVCLGSLSLVAGNSRNVSGWPNQNCNSNSSSVEPPTSGGWCYNYHYYDAAAVAAADHHYYWCPSESVAATQLTDTPNTKS